MKNSATYMILAGLFASLVCFSSASGGTLEALKQEDLQQAQLNEEMKVSRPPAKIYPWTIVTAQALGVSAAAAPLPADTDDDGMPDSYETANGLDAGDPADAWLDPDNDNVVNLFEYQLGSGINDDTTPAVITVASSGADHTEVSAAIDAAAAGSVIRVAEGGYNVNYSTNTSKVIMIQGGWSADFSARDLRLHKTTFDGGMVENKEILYISPSSGASSVILDGINFTGGDGEFGAVNLLTNNDASMKSSIVNCTFIGNSSAFSFGGVLNLHSWGSGRSDRTIANTIIAGNSASGIYSQVTNTAAAHWRLINTTISDNLNGGNSNGYGIYAFTLENGKLTANIRNSIIWGNDQEDISTQEYLPGNISFKAEYSDIDLIQTNAVFTSGKGMVNDDPLFNDPLEDDYHLSASSPLINRGSNTGIPLRDFEGDDRIVNFIADIGADEAGTYDMIADLEMVSVSNPPAKKKRGDKFSVRDIVRNMGTEPTTISTTTRYFLSKNKYKDTGDLPLKGSRTVAELSVGEISMSSKRMVVISRKTRPGKYYVIACADATGIVTERDEDNNCKASKKRIQVIK